uniref:Uncharacterized protein n=1 Tax=Loa loa TaxID=7209 RepID=A0A1I7W1K4_LOALO
MRWINEAHQTCFAFEPLLTNEPQKEPLDLSMSGMYERQIGPSDLSAPEVSKGKVELNEINENDASSLNLPIQEVRRCR